MNATPDTHSKLIGYLLWLFGFTGAHRFYYGKPVSGTIWFFTLGLFLIGWIIDLFLIPSMDRAADRRFVAGPINYSIETTKAPRRLSVGAQVEPKAVSCRWRSSGPLTSSRKSRRTDA